MSGQPEITMLLKSWQDGDHEALDQLSASVYEELKRLARSAFRSERPGHTLQPTALVNEAYLRLIDLERVDWHGKAHFFAMAAKTLRRVLVDHARKSHAIKRDAGRAPDVSCLDLAEASNEDLRVLDVDVALEKLAAVSSRQAQIVEVRFFGGLTNEQAAAVLGLSTYKVKTEWRFARAWLKRELERMSAR